MSMIMSTGRDTAALMEHHLGYLTQCFVFLFRFVRGGGADGPLMQWSAAATLRRPALASLM